MLYDPKWEIKAQPLRSLHSLVAWLETQPSDRAYDYCKPANCLLAEYLRAMGAAQVCLPSDEAKEFFGDHGRVIYGNGLDWTFGEALERARALLSTE